MESILMQEILTNGTGCFEFQAVRRRKGIHTDQLNNLVQFCFLLQETHQTRTQVHPICIYVFIKPFLHGVDIQGITGQPVDRWEMTFVGKIRIQAPKYLDDA